MTKKENSKLLQLIDRTENNIIFYLQEEKNMHLLNEIGVLRGLLYALEEMTGELNIDDFQKDIFRLQTMLTDMDEELKKI